MFCNVFAYPDILEPLMDMYMTVSILYTLLDDVMVSLVCCLESRDWEIVQSDYLICFFLERTANNICSRVAMDMRVVQSVSEWFITIYHVFWISQDTRMLSIPGQGNLFMIYHYFMGFILDLWWFISFFSDLFVLACLNIPLLVVLLIYPCLICHKPL